MTLELLLVTLMALSQSTFVFEITNVIRTDKRGLFYYKFGYDWTHENVVDLYKCLADNGYYFVYLTARSVKVVQ
jgi:phosphatidate phosphatase PAH1